MKLQQWMLLLTLCSAGMLIGLTAECLSDKVTNLPGQPEVSFQQYSGYITVDKSQNRELFYYFVEAERDAPSKPLVLWLNGGPGCSSVGVGAFCEHGPFKSGKNKLVRNQYSWNREANMLYLESPAGVGFSYSANKSFYAFVDDELTARDNLEFLQRWLAKFPGYKNRDFFIAGESYGGHYVPQLAKLITLSKVQLNLKGIALGNPLLEFNTDLNSMAEFMWSHGLISDATYGIFTSVCNFSQIQRKLVRGSMTPVCHQVARQVSKEVSRFINVYDVTLDVCLSSVKSQSQMLYQKQEGAKIDVCVEDETFGYLNRKDVQKALHARLVGISKWTVCSEVLKYNMENVETPSIHLVGELLNSGIKVLAYSGDQDAMIPLTGTRTLVNQLAKELKLETTVPYRVWFQGRQVAGWTHAYGNLSFATVRGASHEAPFSQPERSLALFASFLHGKPLPQTA